MSVDSSPSAAKVDLAPRRQSETSTTSDGPIKVVSGPADWLFKTITPEQREKLPHYKGELLLTEHSAGSISSQSFMKRMNRKNELLAERMSLERL